MIKQSGCAVQMEICVCYVSCEDEATWCWIPALAWVKKNSLWILYACFLCLDNYVGLDYNPINHALTDARLQRNPQQS